MEPEPLDLWLIILAIVVGVTIFCGVAAMANIPEVNSHQTFSVGVGVGGFDGQQAVAVGASARVNDNLTVKASVAANNEEVVWGAGAAFGW